jgi:hypothetical protein
MTTFNLTNLLVAALATWQIIEVYHHSPLFANARARDELSEGYWARVRKCPWCWSFWVSVFPIVMVWNTPMNWATMTGQPAARPAAEPLAWPYQVLLIVGFMINMVGLLVTWMLAASRLANLGNDLAHKWCRTPGREVDLAPPNTDLREDD